MKKQSFNNLIKLIFTFIIVCGMVAASEFLNEKEIIFPEIAAIAIGSFIAPGFSWNTSKIRILISIMTCAILGVLIVLFCPMPLWIQITLAFLVGQMVYLLSGTTFVPMISAIVLPVLLQTKSPVYIAAAFVLTSMILIMRLWIEHIGVVEKQKYIRVSRWTSRDILNVMLRVIVVGIMSFIAMKVQCRFLVAPPLLVAFTEFCNTSSKARKKPVLAVLVITGCALFGAASRLIFVVNLRLSLTLSAAVGLVFVLIIMKMSKMYIPPAGAMMVLAMLIPGTDLVMYPVQVFVGISVLMGAVLGIFKDKHEKEKIDIY